MDSAGHSSEDSGEELLHQLAELEKEFAASELAHMRRKEVDIRPLYVKRQALVSRLPNFWSSIFKNAPPSVQQYLQPSDMAILATLTSLSVDRFELTNTVDGEPRSLRFTFQFGKNEWFEDSKLVKEFRYREDPIQEHGGLVSNPIPIKWKNKKKDVTKGLLDAAVELQAAETAMKIKNGDLEIDFVARENLWQNEKLRTKLASMEESLETEGPSFFNWFGYRGSQFSSGKKQEDGEKEDEADGEEEEEEEDDGMLDVEIFPAGGELANAIAEDMWPGLLDPFVASMFGHVCNSDHGDDDSSDVDEDDSDAPPLVEVERPAKRRRT